MSMGTLGKYGTLMLFIAMIQAYPIGWFVDRFHSLRLTLVATFLFAAVTLVAFFSVQLVANAVAPVIVALACGWTLDQLNHDCRFMYLWAAALASLSAAADVIVYRKFLVPGGVIAYLPPG